MKSASQFRGFVGRGFSRDVDVREIRRGFSL